MSIPVQEMNSGDSESTSRSLPSRHSVKPSSPDYDAVVLAHIKSKLAIDPDTGCWLYQGYVTPQKMTKHGFTTGGYGHIGYRGKDCPVHRAMWILTKGAVPPKMDVCHTCDVRHCCNPGHLWLGTRQQNLLDMVEKKRGNKASKTHCWRGHPLSGDNILVCQRRRKCKQCDEINHNSERYKKWRLAYQRRRRAEKRAARLAQAQS